jgi:DNA modification methylase
MDYHEFLISKIPTIPKQGFTPDSSCPEWFKPHQVDCSHWAIEKGRAALFESFGMGKTVQQLQIMKWVHEKTGGKVLFVAPLGVRQEFTLNDGPRMGMKVIYCRTDAEVAAADSPYIITNYERVRDGGIDPAQFTGATLDEASCLRSYGSLTTQTFVELFRDIPYRFVATATPSPNEFLELINYAHFLGVMDRGQALTRFFQRDSKKAGNLTLYPHMEDQFWLWVASWAVFVNRPSDLGYSDEGYDLPELNVQWHEVQADQGQPGDFRDSFGQALLFEKPGGGIKHVAKNRRKTKDQRIQKAADIIAADPDSHWIIWHYLESERAEIQKLIPDSVAVYGSQDIDDREQIVQDFSNGKISKLSSKPELLGSGCNFQRHCHKAIFIGPTDKFNDFIQAVHRIHRFLQKHGVELHIIYADTQYDTVVIMRNKWERHNELTLRMREIIKQHGLSGEALRMKFERTLGTKRAEVTGKTYRAIHNDCVEELKNFESDSIDEIVTSIPFSDHYEYSPSINDFGHNNGDDGFFKQFDFLVPELLRVLKPGRIAAIHTKDRIQYGKMTGHGMYTVNAFSDKTVQAFQKHGFLYMGRITIDTDVVRENAQSYRLGWSENAEDSTKMGCGSTEFVLLFRKWEPAYSPNGTANGPDPVKKDNSAYTRSHWQLQACGIWRSNGNELLSPEMIARMTMGDIMYWWKSYCETNGYDYEKHVQFCQAVEDLGHLPSGHMLFPPSSNNPDIWTDILRINTLNTALSMKQEQSHVCLAEGSMVLTHKGYKPIEEIDLGDLVLTHKGRWMPVVAKQCTGVNDVVQVKAQGVHNLTLTPTHKVWARNGNGVAKAKQKAISSEPDWVQAKDLDNCYVNLKMPPTMEPANTNKLHWWLVGRWLADGHFGARGCVYISVGRHKQAAFEAKAGELVGPPSGRTTALQYRVRDAGSAVRDILEDCGHGAAGKHIPAIAYTLPEEYAKELLDGYLSGDGHFDADRNKWYCSSVSKELLMGLNFLVQRVHGDIASIHPGREAGTAVIEGRTVDTQQEWILSWGHKSYSFSFMADDGAWKRVKSIIPAGQATTWNIRVAEDESYTAEGCVVKNCPLQLDVIQRLIERFSNPGDTILDPFGGVHSVPYQAIKMGRKGVGIELNPEYWRMGVSFCERAEQKLLAPTLFDLELAEV